MTIGTEQALHYLKQHIAPFSYFSEKTIGQLKGAIRIFQLYPGERLTIRATSDQDRVILVNGKVELEGQAAQKNGLEQNGQYKLEKTGEHISINAIEGSILCHVDGKLLDYYLSLAEIYKNEDISSQDLERLFMICGYKVFNELPLERLIDVVAKLEQQSVAAGEDVVEQDHKGDAFYIIASGQAEVWREEMDDDEQRLVAVLGPGDSFGEEALIIGGGRNATVRMTIEGKLLRLKKSDFDQLVFQPLASYVSPEIAHSMSLNGSIILDVRYDDEYRDNYIPGSLLIPLPDIRSKLDQLDKQQDYLILCARGARAAAAAMIMQQRGYSAKIIDGGINAWTFDTTAQMKLELVLFDFCPYAQRAVITLLHNQIDHKLTYISPDDKPDWFTKISPLGKVPLLRIDNRTVIFESNVINDFVGQLGRGGMLPVDPTERALCRSWIEFCSTLLGDHMKMVKAPDEAAFMKAAKDFSTNLAILEDQMADRQPWFNGQHFSLLETTYAPLFLRMKYLAELVEFYDLEAFPAIDDWATRLLDLDEVKNSVRGDFKPIYESFVKNKGAGGYVANQL